jgi:hypothetical protein
MPWQPTFSLLLTSETNLSGFKLMVTTGVNSHVSPSSIYLSLRTDKLLKTGSLAIPGERVNIPDDVSSLALCSTSPSLSPAAGCP